MKARILGWRWQGHCISVSGLAAILVALLAGCAGWPMALDSLNSDSSPPAVRGADDPGTFEPPHHSESPASPQRLIATGTSEKEHVYIFIINGLDPLHYADLPKLAQHLRSLGYPQVYYSELITAGSLASEIQAIARSDRQARFVLIGYSFGANMARNLTHSLREDGIAVDLLVYLNANTLRNTPYDRPENARRVLNILAWGILLDGAQLDNAENREILDAWHFNTPTHPQTLQLLERELAALISTVESTK